MIEIMITRKNRLEPTLILQLVNDVTIIVKEIKKRNTFFSFYEVYAVYPTQIEFRDHKNSRDQGSKFKA